MLYSENPGERIQGINLLLSQEAFLGQSLAYEPALELYPKETMPDVKRGLLRIISGFSRGKDQRAFDILLGALDDSDSSMIGIVISGLARFGEKAAPAVPKIRGIYQAEPTPGTKRQLMNLITEIGPAAESVFDIITNDLASTSWTMRRATLKAVKKLKKKNVNIVGFLVNQLETGDIDQKVAACAGLGALGDEAKGSVMALAKALIDPISDVRAKAAWALSQMGKNAAPAESALQLALKDDSPMVSKFALKTLSKLKKLTKEQKEDIKQMESIEKEIKAWRAKFKDIYPDAPKEKDEEEAPAEGAAVAMPTKEAPEVNDLIFMSHALPDFTWVKKAMEQIETWPGCRVWTCERDIPTGGDWLESIYGGLENCSWYVLFWSDKAQNSKWTNEEMKEAKTRIVSRGRPKITVVNLGKQDWPLLLQRYQGAMVTTDEQLKTWLDNLKEQVLSGAPAPGEME